MKRVLLLTTLLATGALCHAQEPPRKTIKLPLTVTLFSESVSLPNLRNLFQNANLGIRVGTEFYYKEHDRHQLLQTVNIGFYRHKNLHNGLFFSSEVGYRKLINRAFVDLTAGVGYLLIDSSLPRYKIAGNEWEPTGSTFGRIMPTLGLGAGYRFNTVAVFSRYEIFGEMPFGYSGIPALPHKTLHLGTRLNLH